MKKLYLIPEENDLNCHHSLRCSPLVKAVSLGTVMAALLSSVSPVFAANVAILGSNVQSSNDGSIPYSNGSHGSIVLAGDNNWCGVDNVTDRGKHLPQSSRAVKEISAEEQYERFVNNGEFFNRHPYGVTTEQVKWEADGVTSSNGGYMGSSTTGGHSNVMPTAFGVYSFATGCGSYASGNYSTAFGAGATTNGGGAQAYGVSALAKGQATIAMGVGAEAWDTSAVAVGGRAVALGKNSVALGTKAKASGDYGVALGTEALAKQRGSIAIGGDIPQEENDQGKRFGAMVEAENAIAIGVRSYASEDSKEAVAIGLSAQVRDEAGIALGRGAVVRQGGSAGVAIGASAHVIADTGVALGTASIASTEHNVSGYNPATGATTKSSDHVWVSTRGAVSIGDVSQKVTRQITGVAAGSEMTDAVNVAQLKALRETIDKGWMLTVNGADATPVGADGADFSVGSSNLVITKDNKNKLTFDLAEHIEVGRITTGLSSLSNAGLVIKGCNDGTACKNGPSVTAGGINAGDKTLTGLADGVLDGDAVNVAQLNKVKEAIKGSGLIQQGENEDENGRITIGAGNSGTEINILNKDGVRRTISGISGGKVTEESTEAINGAQLWETNEEVHNLNHRVDETHTNVSQYFGGGADISSGKAPTYTIEGKQYNNVGSAFSAVNDSLDNIQNEISRHFGQIYTISDIFSHYFGGGAGYNNGKWTAPTYEVSHFGTNGTSSEKAYNNVADAFGGVNESMSGMNDRLQEVENKVDQNKAESDSLGWSKDKGAYDASHDGKPSKIVNVADGQVAQGSEDAVNGGQLWETNERVTNVENKVNDVSKQVDSIENTVNHFADGAVSYQRDESGKKTNKVVLQGGDSGKPVTIDNVADGKIEKGSQEAVNGGQLHDYTQEQMKLVLNDAKKYTDGKIKNIVVNAIDDAVSQAKGYTDMKFEALSYGIEGARKEARQAAAIGLAVSNLRYNDTPGRLSFAFGSGMWRSQSAFALGTGYTSEDGKIQSNFSATTAGGHWGIGAGVSITLN